MQPYLIDTHIHLDHESYENDRDLVVEHANEVGVKKIITIGSGDAGYKSAYKAIELTKKYDCVWATVGIHPQDADFEFDPAPLIELAKETKVVGIGETGLDFFYTKENEASQIRWFEANIAVANEVKKPLVIHSREAAAKCFEVLKANKADQAGGVFHCYSEDYEYFKKIIDLNFIISVPGIVTFKNAEKLRDAVKAIPLDCIMLETDGPYLAPVPYRGKRCESGYMVETAKAVAKIKGVSMREVMEVTTKVAESRFKLVS